MSNQKKFNKAIEILKANGITGLGKCRAYASDANSNEVDIHTADGYYCTINIKSGKIKGI